MATIDFENIDSDSTDNKYLDLCKKGRYIEAVKVYKDYTGFLFAEAKAYIDNLRSEYGIKPQSSGQGCMVAISILIIVSFLIFL